MSEIQVASRYAKSLIDLASEQKALDPIKGDIELFIQVCKANTQLQAVLKNPIIGHDKKIAILTSLFGSNVHPVVLSFFKIMINKGRGELLYPTAKEFISEYNQRKGIISATVVSAALLSPENRKKIEQVVKEATGGEVVLEAKVNPDLIGGFVLKVGDKQFDTSLSSALSKLKKEFAQRIITV
jgi:F-type H+-transporting ATPase subunit delta